jgi:hypothetical protein
MTAQIIVLSLPRFVIASEAKQSRRLHQTENWIASSLSLLAMTLTAHGSVRGVES